MKIEFAPANPRNEVRNAVITAAAEKAAKEENATPGSIAAAAARAASDFDTAYNKEVSKARREERESRSSSSLGDVWAFAEDHPLVAAAIAAAAAAGLYYGLPAIKAAMTQDASGAPPQISAGDLRAI